jgi:hypothetical protein
MMATRIIHKLLYYQKFLGLTMIAVGIPISVMSKSSENTSMLIIGLFLLFTSWDKVMDERLASIKATSVYLAIVLSYTFKYMSSELVRQGITSYEMTNINHFILMVFAVANLTYYSRLFLSTNRADD